MISENIRILDAGCGEGFISGLIADCFKTVEVTGLELQREAIQIANERVSNVRFVEGSIYEMPFEENEFDIVVCTEVLEHLDKPEVALKELQRVTKNVVLITVPNEPWFCMGNLFALKNVSRLGNPIDHINQWTYGAFVKFVRQVFGKIRYSTTSFPWSVVLYDKEVK